MICSASQILVHMSPASNLIHSINDTLSLQEDGWKLSRTNYYQEGWLATANVRGVVGVTYTTSFCAGAGQVTCVVWQLDLSLF